MRIDSLKSFKKIFSFFLLSLVAGFLWWTLQLINTFPKKLYPINPSQKSENIGIVVLTGGKNRIEKGVDLLSKGYGDKLLILKLMIIFLFIIFLIA